MQINTLSLVCRELVTGPIPFFIPVDHVYSFIVVVTPLSQVIGSVQHSQACLTTPHT